MMMRQKISKRSLFSRKKKYFTQNPLFFAIFGPILIHKHKIFESSERVPQIFCRTQNPIVLQNPKVPSYPYPNYYDDLHAHEGAFTLMILSISLEGSDEKSALFLDLALQS